MMRLSIAMISLCCRRPIMQNLSLKEEALRLGKSAKSAARELALYGHKVTVLEKHSVPGGMIPSSTCRFSRSWRTASQPLSYSPT